MKDLAPTASFVKALELKNFPRCAHGSNFYRLAKPSRQSTATHSDFVGVQRGAVLNGRVRHLPWLLGQRVCTSWAGSQRTCCCSAAPATLPVELTSTEKGCTRLGSRLTPLTLSQNILGSFAISKESSDHLAKPSRKKHCDTLFFPEAATMCHAPRL